MSFEPMAAEQYRTLDAEQFEQRKNMVSELCLDPECAVDTATLRAEAAVIADEAERRSLAASLRSEKRAAVAAGAGTVVSGSQAVMSRAAASPAEEGIDSMEYRTAFKDFVLTRKMNDTVMQYRQDQTTKTSDLGVLIPTVVVNRIIEKAESLGMILPLVTKTSVPAGVQYPVATFKPEASWVAEGASSDAQKAATPTSINFVHHKLRCEVALTMESHAMALSVFEDKFTESVAKAMVRAKESAIISGDGSGKPKGILSETPEAGQAIALGKGTKLSWDVLTRCEAALPEQYEAGAKRFMSKKSYMAFVGMTDADGQPVARINYGIGGKPERTLLGREVVLTGDYLPAYVAEPSNDTLFAFLFDMSDYVLNSIYDMGIKQKEDWDTEDIRIKAVTACDGKVVDKGSLVTLTIKKDAIV